MKPNCALNERSAPFSPFSAEEDFNLILCIVELFFFFLSLHVLFHNILSDFLSNALIQSEKRQIVVVCVHMFSS